MTLLAAIHADPLGLLVAFGAGMLSFISPCVLPLVPGYVSMVSGLSAAELRTAGTRAHRTAAGADRGRAVGESRAATAGGMATAVGAAGMATGSLATTAVGHGAGTGRGIGGAGSAGALTVERPAAAPVPGEPPARSTQELHHLRLRLLRGILSFIGGFTVVFVALGAGSSTVGHLLFTHKPLLTTISGVLIVVFGAVLVAAASGVRLPAFVVSEHRLAVRPSTLGAWAAPVMGFAFAFAWTPCIGPVLGSVLTLAAGSGSSATGGIVLLLAYSLGLGVPFLLFGLAFGRMTDLVARLRPGMRYVNLIGGAVLVAFGVVLLTGHVDVMSQHISQWLNDLHLGRLSKS